MNLYVARHGQTVSNIEYRLLGGSGDSPLTEKGIEQAKILGERLAEKQPFDAIFVSPLKRARDTLNIALESAAKNRRGELRSPAGTPGIPGVIDPRLIEIDFGAMHDMLPAEAKVKFPKAAGNMLADPASYEPPPGGESIPAAIARIESFLRELISREHENIFVLTHGFMMRIFHAVTVGGSIASIGAVARYENCDLCHYRYTNGIWELVEENRNPSIL